MRLHRFYVGDNFELRKDFWIHDSALIHQWLRVLRYRSGQEVILFDGRETERLYKIVALDEHEAHVELVTDFPLQKPTKEITLIWSLLKKDKNDWVLQKATELGVRHFVPLIAERSEKTGFSIERAEKIVIEAAEQCGRSDIPTVREPMHLQAILKMLGDTPVYLCEQGSQQHQFADNTAALCIGPEGGWTPAELAYFTDHQAQGFTLGAFTLRAETAAVVAAATALRNS